MKEFSFAAMLGAILVSAIFVGAAVGPAHLTAQTDAKRVSFGLQIEGAPEGREITVMRR